MDVRDGIRGLLCPPKSHWERRRLAVVPDEVLPDGAVGGELHDDHVPLQDAVVPEDGRVPTAHIRLEAPIHGDLSIPVLFAVGSVDLGDGVEPVHPG